MSVKRVPEGESRRFIVSAHLGRSSGGRAQKKLRGKKEREREREREIERERDRERQRQRQREGGREREGEKGADDE